MAKTRTEVVKYKETRVVKESTTLGKVVKGGLIVAGVAIVSSILFGKSK
jgi:hypothetical protein